MDRQEGKKEIWHRLGTTGNKERSRMIHRGHKEVQKRLKQHMKEIGKLKGKPGSLNLIKSVKERREGKREVTVEQRATHTEVETAEIQKARRLSSTMRRRVFTFDKNDNIYNGDMNSPCGKCVACQFNQ